MKEYINKAAVVAEIGKLQLCTMDEHMNYYSPEAQGEYNALCKLESFIDTLEVKEVGEPSNDLEEAAKFYAATHTEFFDSECKPHVAPAFIAGAEWYKEQLKYKGG